MIEDIPFYDSSEDKHCPSYITIASDIKVEVDGNTKSGYEVPMAENTMEAKSTEATNLCLEDSEKAFSLDFKTGPGSTSEKKSQHASKGKTKVSGRKQGRAKSVAKLFASKEAQGEVAKYEKMKNRATTELNSLYKEILPAIEEHEWDHQDSVPTSVAKKWMHATCAKYKADANFHVSVIKNFMCPPNPGGDEAKSSGGGDCQESLI